MWGKSHRRYTTPDGGPPHDLRPAFFVVLAARAVFKEDGPIGWDAKAAKPVVLTECCGLLSRKGSPFSRKAVVAFSSHKDTLFGVCTLLQRVGYKGMVQWAFSAQLTQWL